ncbi:MAG: hypothetical protein IJ405_02495 [Lachnospiraceae bacterium]|nr:hypothetical protein [Lachnospiraceae bacterium]
MVRYNLIHFFKEPPATSKMYYLFLPKSGIINIGTHTLSIEGLPMKKDTHLINIYLKIHHKKTLTMDDLRYLAKYSPECFEKTCKNVVYNFPEAKPVMEPQTEKKQNTALLVLPQPDAKPPESQHIDKILENLKHLDADQFTSAGIDVEKVKTLLGNLYMELLFPHNDKEQFINVMETETSRFDKKA